MLGLDNFIQRPLNALTGLFGSVNDRKIKAKQPMVARINALEPEFEKKSDSELLAMTATFKERLRNGTRSGETHIGPAPFRRSADRRHDPA
jgi:preprotein translocase subunit SecA